MWRRGSYTRIGVIDTEADEAISKRDSLARIGVTLNVRMKKHCKAYACVVPAQWRQPAKYQQAIPVCPTVLYHYAKPIMVSARFLMLIAAFKSRSMCDPHDGQSHVLS